MAESEYVFCVDCNEQQLKSECEEVWATGIFLPKATTLEFFDEFVWTCQYENYPVWKQKSNVEQARTIQNAVWMFIKDLYEKSL